MTTKKTSTKKATTKKINKSSKNKITINGQEFETKRVSPGVQFKLNRTFRRKVNIVELPETNKMVELCIGKYALKFLKYRTRFYKCDVITRRANSLRRFVIKDIGKTVGEIFDVLENNNIKVHLHGGTISDFFIGAKSTDIDIIFDTHVGKLEKICVEQTWPCKEIRYQNQYINFGEDKGISLEGSNLKNTYLLPMFMYEFTANNFTYDYKNGILIDIAGQGLTDVLNRKIRITPYPNQFQKWAHTDYKKPLRYFKMLQKGFVPLNARVHKFICGYIEDNFENVYSKRLYPKGDVEVSKLKHYIVYSLTNGQYNDDGTFELGVNKHKLYPYLKEFQKYLDQQTVNKIFDILETDKIITPLTKQNLLRYKKRKITDAIRISKNKLSRKYNKSVKLTKKFVKIN